MQYIRHVIFMCFVNESEAPAHRSFAAMNVPKVVVDCIRMPPPSPIIAFHHLLFLSQGDICEESANGMDRLLHRVF